MVKMDFKMFFILQITIFAVCPSFLMSSLFTANEISAAVMDGVDDKKMNQMNGDMESKHYWNKYVENLSLRNLKNVDNYFVNNKLLIITREQQKKNFFEVARRRSRRRKLRRKKLTKRRRQVWFNQKKRERERKKKKRSVETQEYSDSEEQNDNSFIPMHHHHHHHHHYNPFMPREEEAELRNKETALRLYYWWCEKFITVTDPYNNSTTLAPQTMMPLSKVFYHDNTTTTPQPNTEHTLKYEPNHNIKSSGAGVEAGTRSYQTNSTP